MAGQGTGPSRRSHTKSRKGCKTCKRRHIRCDETFPQCRNCTKHQVRCDYMESVGSDGEGQASPDQTSIVLTPTTESTIDLWQQTGSFPYPALHVFPPPQTHDFTRNELRLMHHLCAISNDLTMRGTASLTIWTQKVPKFLSIASSYPYVMHALLSFSANHLAWTQSSAETKNLQIHYGTIALRGLHDAIGSFSHANADAVLAASLLLLWQASDWRSWSSLRAGIQSVIAAMQSWKHDSIFADYISEEDLLAEPNDGSVSPFAANPNERYTIMANTIDALQRLQATLAGNEVELYWAGQLLQYVERLQASPPAQSADEQLSHLYLLRKWLFWVPVQLLQGSSGQGPAMLTMAHFFATALALEPLYPDLGSAFCARIALSPLETILSLTEAMQSQHPLDPNSIEIATLIQYPQQMAINFRSRMLETYQGLGLDGVTPTFLGLSPEILSYATIGNISPAFAPSIPHAPTLPSTPSSTYLEVPSTKPGFSYGTQGWGAMPSPGFPPPAFTVEEEQYYSSSFDHFRGGFVPTPIWT